MGYAGVMQFGGLRIAGLSGIWKGYNYNRPHNERLPFSADDLKSVYHVREWDVRKLLQVRRQVDVGISHDWPRGVEWKGDWKGLFRKKQGFEEDARTGKLGSEAARKVMRRLRPRWWFSAHLHVKFAGVVKWDEEKGEGLQVQVDALREGGGGEARNRTGNPNEIPIKAVQAAEKEIPAPVRNEDEIELDMDDDEPVPSFAPGTSALAQTNGLQSTTPPEDGITEDVRSQLPASFSKPRKEPEPQPLSQPPPEIHNKTTEFLALDKCLPKRKFLQFLELDPIRQTDGISTSFPQLQYDKEWLAITRVFAHEGDPTKRFSAERAFPPDKGEAYYAPLIAAQEDWVEDNLVQKAKMTIPDNFLKTADVYDSRVSIQTREQPKEYTNPQSVAFCDLLGIENHFDATEEDREERRQRGPAAVEARGGMGGTRGGQGGRGRGSGGFGRGRGRGGRRGF